ncbi:MAG: L-lysine 6-transaminase [Bacteroidetes bacterium]|nr:L-lysine 6-transaminase [Bacteroidota bacterium]
MNPAEVKKVLGSHILADGMNIVMDLERSHGSYVYDSLGQRELLDFFTCFATIPLGYNHPGLKEDKAFMDNLLLAALGNPSNSDVYTEQYADFVETFGRVGIPDYLPHAFFVAGGALAVENAMKVAMDWKVQKNFEKGYTYEKGTRILHFREAFHGRSGYTMSVTNTDPTKVKYFAKFDWPRVLNPKLRFPLDEASLADVAKAEALSLRQIERAFREYKDEIAAVIIEPIQGEGGDNHFRTVYMEQLRRLCDENEALLIYDEVQMGMGATGKFWAHQHFGPNARPDIISFGKKMQVCGILAGPRVDEVETNVFRVPSRINSTWGGNLVDMVRASQILKVMEADQVLDHVALQGQYFTDQLQLLAARHKGVTNVRGRGLIVAFDLPNRHLRDQFITQGMQHNVLFLGCADRSIRFRPTLTITREDLDKGLEVIDTLLGTLPG